MSIQEENFKICGLCSQLVDESVVNNEALRSFLSGFLNVTEDSLPTKTCLECYKVATESKRFKDACIKSITKLQSSKVASSMILGGKGVSFTPKPAPKATPTPAKKATPQTESSKKKKILESLGLNPDAIDIDISAGRASRSRGNTESNTPLATPSSRASRAKATPVPATPTRSSRSSSNVTPATPTPANRPTRGRNTTPKQPKDSRVRGCKIMIKKIERLRADRHFAKHGVVRNSRKRGAVEAEVFTPPPVPAKRLRKGYAYEPVPIAEAPPAKKAATPPNKSRSSFGRVRNNKTRSNDYVYDTSEAEQTPPKNSKVDKKKATPAKKEPEPAPEEDMEEVFPTIGPYQCEICQMITDTKADFVGHIKAKHRDVVDEEVLRSLESDIRKSNKKKGGAPPKSPPKPAPKSPPKKAKAKPKPASKKAKPAPKPAPKPKPKPASKAKSKPAKVILDDPLGGFEATKVDAPEEDPLGGLEETNGIEGTNAGDEEPAVVMENAEEDTDQPQAQQDNTDELGSPVQDKIEAIKKNGADIFDRLFDDSAPNGDLINETDNNVIVQPIPEAPHTLGF